MKFTHIACIFSLVSTGLTARGTRQALDYAALPSDVYAPPVDATATTLADFIKSHSELSMLANLISECGGYSQAFETVPTWSFTFFAPSNKAFNNTGAYFATYAATPKGKWWLGNLLQHHYVPNTQLKTSAFTNSTTRIQTGSFLYVGTQVVNGQLMLNNVSAVTSANLPVTSGLVHIIDHILDPSAQVYEPDVTKTSQSFIAGSCSNPLLPYC